MRIRKLPKPLKTSDLIDQPIRDVLEITIRGMNENDSALCIRALPRALELSHHAEQVARLLVKISAAARKMGCPITWYFGSQIEIKPMTGVFTPGHILMTVVLPLFKISPTNTYDRTQDLVIS